MILRTLSGLAGLAMLAASAYATIAHTGADEATQGLIWASVGGLVIGAAVITNTKHPIRWLLVLLMLCGESYGAWMAFERVVEIREGKAAVGRAQSAALAKAEDRLTKAEAALQTAEQTAADQAPLKDCKAKCAEMNTSAVNRATAELKAARAVVEGLPVPTLSDVSATQTGIPAWKISLALAVALALSTNGMGAALVGFAAHSVTPVQLPVSESVKVDFQPPKIIVSDEPAPMPPPVSRKKRFPETNVVDFQQHKVLRVLENQGKPVSNSELARLLGETEGEASKSWREVAEHLEIGRQGKELRIQLRRTA